MLAPAQLTSVSTLFVPANPGFATSRYLVPNQPGLIGVRIPLQAVIMHGPTTFRLTNAVLLQVEL